MIVNDGNVTLRESRFTFLSDHGVFSKNEVDFGSRLLIEAFQMPDVKGNVLDVGCGYGPIGLSLAKEFQNREIHMVDVNERALGLAKENAANNRIENIRILQSSVYENVDGKYAAILSNPPIRAGKDIVHEILEKAVEYLVSRWRIVDCYSKETRCAICDEKTRRSIF